MSRFRGVLITNSIVDFSFQLLNNLDYDRFVQPIGKQQELKRINPFFILLGDIQLLKTSVHFLNSGSDWIFARTGFEIILNNTEKGKRQSELGSTGRTMEAAKGKSSLSLGKNNERRTVGDPG